MRQWHAKTILMVLAATTFGCGKKDKNSEKSNAAAATSTATSASTTADTATELADKPKYATGSCTGNVGCIQGFISHGMKLTLTPDGTGTDKTASGEALALQTYEFKDAQDFGDRFDTAFLKPLVPAANSADYDFKIAPTVKRDNFANDFELYSEGSEANDDKVKMEGEGNFDLGDIAPFDQVALRAVKTFRIEITKKVTADAATPAITRAVTCLELEVSTENLKVVADKPTKIGGLRNFKFYYTESDELCQASKVGDAQSRDTSASILPATGANIP